MLLSLLISAITTIVLGVLKACGVWAISGLMVALPIIIVCGFWLLLFALVGIATVLNLKFGGSVLTVTEWKMLCSHFNKPFAKNVHDFLDENTHTITNNVE